MFEGLNNSDSEEEDDEEGPGTLLTPQGREEAEVLSAIYGEDFERNDLTFSVVVGPSQWPKDCEAPKVRLRLTVAKDYPASPVEAIDVDVVKPRVPGGALAALRKTLRRKADALKGDVAVHELATATAEALEDLAASAMDLKARMMEREKLERQQDEEAQKLDERIASVDREITRSKTAQVIASQVERRDRQAFAETIHDEDELGDLDDRLDDRPDIFDDHCVTNDGGSRYRADFKELQLVGRGGFGDVTQCLNRLDRKVYALKRVRLPPGATRTDARRQLREVDALASVFHPHIVRYYQSWVEESSSEDRPSSEDVEDFLSFDRTTTEDDASSDENSSSSSSSSEEKKKKKMKDNPNGKKGLELYIQMEYCETNLRDVIDAGKLVHRREDAWRLLRQVVDALAYLHGPCGMVHRDLKPANIFVAGGKVKVGDLGLATTVTDDDPASPENINNMALRWTLEDASNQSQTRGVGTALYRAPEVLGSHYDSAADMFSLGIVFYEMLHPPFSTGMERIECLNAVRREDFPDDDDSDDDPQTGQNLVRRLVAHDPSKRPKAATLLQGKEPTLVPPSADAFEDEGSLLARAEATIRDPFSKARQRLISAVFDAPATELIEFTYGRSSSEKRSSGKKSAGATESSKSLKVRWERDLRTAFELRGAVAFSAPLLRPRPRDDDTSASARQVELIDPNGAVVVLPTELTTPFARYVGGLHSSEEKLSTVLRRYEVGRTYYCAGSVVKERFEAAYDVVRKDDSTRTLEAECLRLATTCGDRKIVVGHADLCAAADALRDADADFAARIDGLQKKKDALTAVASAVDRIRRTPEGSTKDRSRRRALAAITELRGVLEAADVGNVVIDVDGKWRARKRRRLYPYGDLGVYFLVLLVDDNNSSVKRHRSVSIDASDNDDDPEDDVLSVGGRYGIERFVAPGRHAKQPKCVGARFFFHNGPSTEKKKTRPRSSRKEKPPEGKIGAMVCGDGTEAGDDASFRFASKLHDAGCVAVHIPRARPRPLRKEEDALAAETPPGTALVVMKGDIADVRFDGRRAELPRRGLESAFSDGSLRTALAHHQQQKKKEATTEQQLTMTTPTKVRFIDFFSTAGEKKRHTSSDRSSLVKKRALQALRSVVGNVLLDDDAATTLVAVDAPLTAIRRVNTAILGHQSVNPPSALRTYVDHLVNNGRGRLWIFSTDGGLDFLNLDDPTSSDDVLPDDTN